MRKRQPNFINLTGHRFGRLVVTREETVPCGNTRWRCLCDCGVEKVVEGSNLRHGRQLSCGCLNDEKRQARNEASRKDEAHKREVRRKSSLKWARENKEYTRQQYLAYKSDPVMWDAILERARDWSRRNPEHKRALTRNRRARLRNALGVHTPEDITEINNLQRGRCAICHKRLDGKHHVDHIVPLSSGGANDRRNLQLLCAPCNLGKWAYDPVDYMRSLGRLL